MWSGSPAVCTQHWARIGQPRYLTPSHMLEFTGLCLGFLPSPSLPWQSFSPLSPTSSPTIVLSPDYTVCLLSCQAPSLSFLPNGNSLFLCLPESLESPTCPPGSPFVSLLLPPPIPTPSASQLLTFLNLPAVSQWYSLLFSLSHPVCQLGTTGYEEFIGLKSEWMFSCTLLFPTSAKLFRVTFPVESGSDRI